MTKYYRTFLIAAILGISFLLISSNALQATDTDNTPKPTQDNIQISKESRELKELIKTLRNTRQDYYKRKQICQSEIDKSQENINILQEEVAKLRKEYQQIQDDIAKSQRDIAKEQKSIIPLKQSQAQTSSQIDQAIASELEMIQKGIPYKINERTSSLIDIAESSDIKVSDKFIHLWSNFQKELALARSSESYSSRIHISADRLQYAKVLRIGHRVLAYLTEDGKSPGIWLDSSSYTGWNRNLQENERQTIDTALRILENREIPDYVHMTVVLSDNNDKAISNQESTSNEK